ncbi:MAG: TIGR03862 family flavoprotein [Alphaproteobacteria bacterium]
MLQSLHIAIIGAGPCGLMAAEVLAMAGLRVSIYDQMPSPARKLLIAGRGGLNLTHTEPRENLLQRYGAAMEWLRPAIEAFPPEALRAWCEGLGQETFIGSSGRVFPKSMKAVALLRAWLKRLEELGVNYYPRHEWQGWQGLALQFLKNGAEIITVQPDATLLALGGASWPRLGSNGQWLDILLKDNIEIAPLRPANCGFIVPWSDYFSQRFAGQPLKPIAITHEGITRQGEAMITAQGIEGGVIYALSASLRDAIEAKGSALLQLDLRPSMTLEALTQKLHTHRGRKSLASFLRSVGFSSLAISLLHEVTAPEQLKLASPANLAAPANLATMLKNLPLTLTANAGMARAISSAGGIKQVAMTEDFMLKARIGVFAAGEMLDWEAPTGGYLLQACFSTAVAASGGIIRYCQTLEGAGQQ